MVFEILYDRRTRTKILETIFSLSKTKFSDQLCGLVVNLVVLSLSKNYVKEEVTQDKAYARIEELREKENTLTHKIQALKEGIPVPLRQFIGNIDK